MNKKLQTTKKWRMNFWGQLQIIIQLLCINFILHLNEQNLFLGFKQEEQTSGPDSGTGWHRGQVPGEPDHGQGQVQGKAPSHLQSRQSNCFLQIGKNRIILRKL